MERTFVMRRILRLFVPLFLMAAFFAGAKEVKADGVMKEGTYVIHSALNDSKVLDIASGSLENGGNLQIYTKNGTDAQKFIVTEIGTGQYMISNLKSFKAVDVKGGKKTSGTNVQQYTPNFTAAQKWRLEDAGGGFYYIRGIGSGLYLSVLGGRTANSTNVCIETFSQSAAQKFRFEMVDKNRNWPDGVFTVKSKFGKVLDVKAASLNNTANVQLYKSNGTDAQKFRLEYAGNGFYTIYNENSGKALDVSGGRDKNGANVQQYTGNGSNAQKWKIVSTGRGDGTHNLISATGSRVLDVSGGKSADGTNIHIWQSNGTDSQQFFLEPTTGRKKVQHVVEIDPGHQRHGNSGKEPIGPGASTKKTKVSSGARSQWTGQEEYQLNLEVSLKLKRILEDRGYKVYMTRTTNNVNITNKERAQKAAKDGAGIMVRIHANDIDATSYKGVLNMAPSSGNRYLSSKIVKESQRLAKLLTKYQCRATGQISRGVSYRNDMTGINWSTIPVTIVEMGFMSNRQEAYFLKSTSGQNLIAKGIADGIDAYFANEK